MGLSSVLLQQRSHTALECPQTQTQFFFHFQPHSSASHCRFALESAVYICSNKLVSPRFPPDAFSHPVAKKHLRRCTVYFILFSVYFCRRLEGEKAVVDGWINFHLSGERSELVLSLQSLIHNILIKKKANKASVSVVKKTTCSYK